MKILFIAPSLPINNGAGHAIRSYHVYTELCGFADVDVLSSNPNGVSYPLAKEFRENHSYMGHIDIGWKEYFFGFKKRLHRKLKKILNEGCYDYVFIRYYNTALRLGALKLKNLILDCDDCYMELLVQQNSELELKKIAKLKKNLSFKFRCYNYQRNLKKVRKVIFSKQSSQISWRSNFTLVPNKIAYRPFSIPASINKKAIKENVKILFIGVLNYAPNYEGLYHFVTNIWPRVFDECPQAKLKIVGSGLPEEYFLKWKNDCSIELCGYVHDIENVYKDIDIAIAPVYKGSGTHIKVMESLLRGKTMVISPLAHRGFEDSLLDSEALFVAPSVESYAKCLINLIKDKEMRITMGNIGRKAVIANHTLGECSLKFKEIIYNLSLIEGKRASRTDSQTILAEVYE
ncbi:glycosyltransferase family 4 protein [Teredinibacter haidensis]|uniref:glycosyltransferase family 4 protein n=1 Tax=Teredinibacter haidensis TaxID=2731755 RepID=UPI0009490FC7|nr:glycosyltransferase family 4 protein [Teredinibacter haidensis]